MKKILLVSGICGIISLASLATHAALQRSLANSATCVISGKPAVEGKSVTLLNELSPDIRASSCGCCTSNNLGNAGAKGTLAVVNSILGWSSLSVAGISLLYGLGQYARNRYSEPQLA